MEGRRREGAIVLEGDAIQRFHRPSGIGTPGAKDTLRLTWLEALHLLDRGDLDAVDGAGVADLLGAPPDPAAVDRWLVYRDLRDRGYYVAPTYPPGEAPAPPSVALVTRPRGAEATSDRVAHHVAVVTETTAVRPARLEPCTLAIVDADAEVTYVDVDDFDPAGSVDVPTDAGPAATSVGRRTVVEDPPASWLEAMFGTALDGRVALGPLEARYLRERGLLPGGADAGADPRFRVYAALRDAGCAPRSGLKFGADFRVYADLADDPGHSAWLVDVIDPDATRVPRELARAVRLATGVRKRHVFAAVEDDAIRWVAFDRARP